VAGGVAGGAGGLALVDWLAVLLGWRLEILGLVTGNDSAGLDKCKSDA